MFAGNATCVRPKRSDGEHMFGSGSTDEFVGMHGDEMGEEDDEFDEIVGALESEWEQCGRSWAPEGAAQTQSRRR